MYDIDGLRKALRAKEIHLHRPTVRPSDDRLMFLKSVLHSTWTLIWHNDEMSSLSFVGDSCQQVSMYCVDTSDTKNTKISDNLSEVSKTTTLLDSVLSNLVGANYPVFEMPELFFLSNIRETSICRLGGEPLVFVLRWRKEGSWF